MTSYTVINEIFFGIKSVTNETELNRLKQYYYNESEDNNCGTPDLLEKIENISVVEENPIAVDVRNKPSHTDEKDIFFEPKQKDTLFWCVFNVIYGELEYMMIGSKYANRELEEKSKMIAEFKKSSTELRSVNHKMTIGSIQEMMSEYMTCQTETTFLGLIGYSVFYKLKIILVDNKKKTHIVIAPPHFMKSCVIYKDNNMNGFIHQFSLNMPPSGAEMNGLDRLLCESSMRKGVKYRLLMNNVDKYIDYITHNYFCLEGYLKPLRAISNYYKKDLDEIAKYFGLPFDSKTKKEEIYNRISEYIVWR